MAAMYSPSHTSLLKSVQDTLSSADEKERELPFSIYSSIREQHIFNVPIMKPLLIFVLGGEKHLGKSSQWVCHSGEFVFLSNKTTIDMRNIPSSWEYYALLIEFDYEDFHGLPFDAKPQETFCMGQITSELEAVLQQFVEWSSFAPTSMWSARKRELLQFLCHLGYNQIPAMMTQLEVSHKIYDLISQNLTEDLSIEYLCSQMAMSESTLRRRLKAEGTGLQDIKDQARLGYGLHLLQSTLKPIGYIAEQCGYQSQSRFTDRFKQRFGLTPTELRKTRLND